MSKLKSIAKEYVLSNNVVCYFQQFENRTTQYRVINTATSMELSNETIRGSITDAEKQVTIPMNMVVSISYGFYFEGVHIAAVYQGNNSYQLNGTTRGVPIVQARNLDELIKVVRQYA